MLLTTFRKDLTPVKSPVWVVSLGDDRVGFWTSSGSGKVKRLAHTSHVTVQASDARGKVKKDSTELQATARVVTGAEYDEICGKVRSKYGVQTKFTKYIGTLIQLLKGKRIPYGDRGVIVTLDA